jgi:hypothetical protein
LILTALCAVFFDGLDSGLRRNDGKKEEFLIDEGGFREIKNTATCVAVFLF